MTKWSGLWYNGHSIYAGQVIKKADIPKFTRIILRHNKYWTEDSNRPRFVYTFADSNEYRNMVTRLEEQENDVGDEEYIRLDTAIRIAREMLSDMQYGFSYDDLTVEVASFMEQEAVRFKYAAYED